MYQNCKFYNKDIQTACGAHPTPQLILGSLSVGVKWLGCEADDSPSFSAEVKSAWSYPSIPLFVILDSVQLLKKQN